MQDNYTLKKLLAKNNCDVVIVPHNLTNKFQPLDLSVNKAAKSFIQNKYNDWFADQVFTQLQNGKDPTNVRIHLFFINHPFLALASKIV